jgi:hypothetical protein
MDHLLIVVVVSKEVHHDYMVLDYHNNRLIQVLRFQCGNVVAVEEVVAVDHGGMMHLV